ncbi:hypothetical protein SAY86_020706 [Trapa natans]|uniref:RING-type E3 ubiquitin transferase n=1 Tax=Trapa natans TaxID=22666 RepID=A0AAN7LP80_TRANT|nr:hypothetical protein SAY86_020706 [Trapa natans]
MGGCCCTTRKPQFHGSTAYYYYPATLEDADYDGFESPVGPIPAITSGLLVDLNLDASIPDNFHAPPAPLPYDVALPSQSTGSSVGSGSNFDDTSASRNPIGVDSKPQSVHLIILPKKLEEISKSNEIDIFAAADEDDVCPICLEEYDKENPRLLTKCEHHFHLSCILEWMERSDVCPMCDKVLVLDNSFD